MAPAARTRILMYTFMAICDFGERRARTQGEEAREGAGARARASQ